MKNKKITYLLLVLVLVLWGIIARQLIDYTSSTSVEPEPVHEPRPPAADSVTHLLLDYRDPFLSPPKKTIPEKKETSVLSPPVPPTPVVKERPPIEYKGIIRKGKQLHAIIKYGNTQETIAPAGTIEGYRLLSVTEDSVIFGKGSERFVFKKSER